MNRLHTAARTYASRFQLKVLPLVPRQKIPTISGGFKSASNDPFKIDRWWSQLPNSNIGIVPGSRGLVVLDIDRRSEGDETLEALERTYGQLPNTWTTITRNGFHLWFRSPEHASFAATLGPGIDIKHSGGYVLGPPSIHPSGHVYTWDSGRHPTETDPEWLPFKYVQAARLAQRVTELAPGIGDAADTFLGEAFRLSGWLGPLLHDGKRIVCCPWHDEHTVPTGKGRDSSTALLPPSDEIRIGWFCCKHSHCANRSLEDLYSALSLDSLIRATHAYPVEHRILRRLIEKRRSA